MESIIATNSLLKGKCFSCNETSVNLTLCASSLNALASCCLYRKVIAPMVVEETSVVEFVAKVWNKPVSVLAMGDGSKDSNVFGFGFAYAEDRKWALLHGPWCIRGYTLVLRAWTPATDGLVVFHLLRVGIHLHNLPHEYFSVSNGNLLGGLVGKVVKVDLQEEKPALWDDFLKVLVDIDINAPLVSGFFFDVADGVKKWIQVKYEKIGIFCYFCGRLGHQRRGCRLSSPVMVTNVNGTPFPMFGPWLSTVSAYRDVFSGPKPVASHRVLAATQRKATGILESMPATMEGGGVDPKLSISNQVRRPRHSAMVTSRGAASLGQSQRRAWLPKSGPFRSVNAIASFGRGKNTEGLVEGKTPDCLPIVVLNENDRSKKGIDDLNKETVGENGDNGLCAGPSSNGPRLGNFGGPPLFISDDVASNQNGINEMGIGPVPLGPCLSSNEQNNICASSLAIGPSLPDGYFKPIGPEFNESNGFASKEGGNGKLRDKDSSSLVIYNEVNALDGIGQAEKPTLLVPSSEPDVVCGAKVLSDEEKALSKFFQAQEKLLYDLKNFGELDLYEIRKIGGDIGVPASSKINERTTPFKKRKFEASASLCSRPHKIHRKHPDVVRDFPWDTNRRHNDSRELSDEPSEESFKLGSLMLASLKSFFFSASSRAGDNTSRRCKTAEAEDGRSRKETRSRFMDLGGVDGTPVVLTKNRVRRVLGHLWPPFSRRHQWRFEMEAVVQVDGGGRVESGSNLGLFVFEYEFEIVRNILRWLLWRSMVAPLMVGGGL
ncbi:hypothetical protein G4B88_028276 [Cannabis sativa]|uniref:CCHC-type domain-containing protein n=1 Tax=Cannabis sativa TaxID=3483 RepID=A0A7J6GD89_CANSA|nr:hypothetical protein G4B88_028276 [Cannabis sativa]